MTSNARFDIRIPIGGLFVLLGLVLAVYGVITKADAELYARAENIDINLWWGLVMMVFGGVMLFFGTRRKPGIS